MSDDFDPPDDDQDCDDLHCPPVILFDNDRCTCGCHQRKPDLAETVTGYVMLFGVAALCVWLLHAMACS